ncbi:MAG: chemotaxis protein CheX [Treponema sp.]|jgi:chemotaxis protein CheX|nr:chemotaxis protein CheX [Treponema sp.]
MAGSAVNYGLSVEIWQEKQYIVDVEQYIQPFVQVTSNVFKELMKTEIKPERAYFIGKEAFLDWDISGIIALTGQVKGLVAISMKNSTAQRITRILTDSQDVTNSDMVDSLGELANIIAGNVKKSLEDLFRITISLPKVVSGMAHMVVIPDDRTRLLCIPFNVFENEVVCLSINISDR